HKSASAVAAGPKLVIIELGADGEAVKKLSAASTLEVKTARTTFKLPLDGFAQSFAEVEACYGALEQPVANPFLPAEGAQEPAAASPKSDTPRDAPRDARSDAEAPAAASEKSGSDNTTAPPSAKYTTASVPNAGPAKVDLDDGLVIERTFLAVPNKTPYRLEALVVRPATANGRLPIALITHGKNATAAENQSIRA